MTASETALLVAAVGLLSAVIGGFIQAISTRTSEHFKFERQAKWDLYSKYFLVLGELTFSDEGTERHTNALSLMAQVRGRIGVVGSAAVVEAIGAIFSFSDLRSAEAQVAMTKALDAMRQDVGNGRAKISQSTMIQLMFGSRSDEQ
jgi:hypothetical protein